MKDGIKYGTIDEKRHKRKEKIWAGGLVGKVSHDKKEGYFMF